MKLIRYEYPSTQADRFFDRFFDVDFPAMGRFSSLFENAFGAAAAQSPRVDLYEDDKNYYARLELPGMKKKDIDVALEKSVLTISAEKVKLGDDSEVSFSRSISVPDDVDAASVKAAYADGILTVAMAKQEARKPRQITVH